MGSSASKAGWQPSAAQSGAAKISASGYDITPMTRERREQAAASLPAQTRNVALQAGTERAFTGKTVDGTPHDSKRKGVYVSAVGGLPLFSSDTKFDSGTGKQRCAAQTRAPNATAVSAVGPRSLHPIACPSYTCLRPLVRAGWPSFYAPLDPAHVLEIKDTSIPFMPRVEVVDARSGAHLGHGERQHPAFTSQGRPWGSCTEVN
jgi:peptide methionine sulfoxide reductase MsrB